MKIKQPRQRPAKEIVTHMLARAFNLDMDAPSHKAKAQKAAKEVIEFVKSRYATK